MADWHVKLVEVRRSGTGPVYVGERFGTTYIMSRKKQNRQEAEAEVLRCEPWTTLVFRHHIRTQGARPITSRKPFNCRRATQGQATLVEHTVDFAGGGCRCGCGP